MGRIARQVSEHTTRYYWYPGDKKEWARAALALGSGAMAFTLIGTLSGSPLGAGVCGASVTAVMAGVNFGRRDARALSRFPDPADRRAVATHTGRAMWRGFAEGAGVGVIAVLVAALPPGGFIADWVMPLVPAVLGSLARQGTMLWERLGYESPKHRRVPAVETR
ncbi:hypothetical protein Val02_27350 [Virgisporangium aliadipatigenens]|uniref:Uncharacterized protein n=1 Tax=Virgisporangium aliadipatigenens TaxID=741659 RepID=A0A8J4DPT4_9ACTN|nr:hypothetical protein [Virgisporangium aliadipatigenens]GIJ45849.1 hypothetical protein Val02_27350 [Virgisporangium aliadipatigenens]